MQRIAAIKHQDTRNERPMVGAWRGPYKNPMAAARAIAEEEDVVKRFQECLYEITEWTHIESDSFLDDLLQEIAGATNIVVTMRGEDWYGMMDNG